MSKAKKPLYKRWWFILLAILIVLSAIDEEELSLLFVLLLLYGLIFMIRDTINYYRNKKKGIFGTNISNKVQEKNTYYKTDYEIVDNTDESNLSVAVIHKHNIPTDIIDLLWFSDGRLKNYDPDSAWKDLGSVGSIGMRFVMNTFKGYYRKRDKIDISIC